MTTGIYDTVSWYDILIMYIYYTNITPKDKLINHYRIYRILENLI